MSFEERMEALGERMEAMAMNLELTSQQSEVYRERFERELAEIRGDLSSLIASTAKFVEVLQYRDGEIRQRDEKVSRDIAELVSGTEKLLVTASRHETRIAKTGIEASCLNLN